MKSFYSANLLFDVIKQFGDVSEEVRLAVQAFKSCSLKFKLEISK